MAKLEAPEAPGVAAVDENRPFDSADGKTGPCPALKVDGLL